MKDKLPKTKKQRLEEALKRLNIITNPLAYIAQLQGLKHIGEYYFCRQLKAISQVVKVGKQDGIEEYKTISTDDLTYKEATAFVNAYIDGYEERDRKIL